MSFFPYPLKIHPYRYISPSQTYISSRHSISAARFLHDELDMLTPATTHVDVLAAAGDQWDPEAEDSSEAIQADRPGDGRTSWLHRHHVSTHEGAGRTRSEAILHD